MKRELVVPGIYKHFKNKLYCTIGVSKPIDLQVPVTPEYMKKEKIYMCVKHTETNKRNTIVHYEDKWVHDKDFSDTELVLYKSLHNDTEIYARPLDMFLSEVDQEKYPDIEQKERMELVGGLFDDWLCRSMQRNKEIELDKE